jgi:hypothetical protein
LKASGTKRLKLKYYEPLLNVAFKFNSRHYAGAPMPMTPRMIVRMWPEGKAAITAAEKAAARAAGAYFCPLLGSTLHTFCGIRWVPHQSVSDKNGSG